MHHLINTLHYNYTCTAKGKKVISYYPCLPSDFETRCPRGKKTILYHKCQLEKMAEYLNKDGLVTRLTLYNDTASKQNSFS